MGFRAWDSMHGIRLGSYNQEAHSLGPQLDLYSFILTMTYGRPFKVIVVPKSFNRFPVVFFDIWTCRLLKNLILADAPRLLTSDRHRLLRLIFYPPPCRSLRRPLRRVQSIGEAGDLKSQTSQSSSSGVSSRRSKFELGGLEIQVWRSNLQIPNP